MNKEESNALKGVALLMMFLHHCFAFPSRYEGFQIVTFFLSEASLNKIAAFCKITVVCLRLFPAMGFLLKLHIQWMRTSLWCWGVGVKN